jgi:hypothetical protein
VVSAVLTDETKKWNGVDDVQLVERNIINNEASGKAYSIHSSHREKVKNGLIEMP